MRNKLSKLQSNLKCIHFETGCFTIPSFPIHANLAFVPPSLMLYRFDGFYISGIETDGSTCHSKQL